MTTVVAVSQFAAGTDVAENRRKVREGVQSGAALGAKLIVFPECAMSTGSTPSEVKYSEPLDGAFATEIESLAREFGVHIIAGMTETAPQETKVFNTLIHATPVGISGLYRKLHLYDAFGERESEKIIPASHVPPLTFQIDGVTFGAMTCYDLRFPEMARYLVDAGAEVLLVPAAWVAGASKEYHWDVLLKARAIENTCYVLGAGQTGPACVGQSLIVDPMGVVIAAAGEKPGTVGAVVDAKRIESVRDSNPCLQLRRFAVVPSSGGAANESATEFVAPAPLS